MRDAAAPSAQIPEGRSRQPAGTIVGRPGTVFALCTPVSFRLLGAVWVLAACGDNFAAAPDAGVDGAAGQGSPAIAELAINEVSPRPGDGPDWIEIANRSGAPIDLCDYFLSDSLDRLDHYLPLGGAAPPDPCEPALLAPGVYLVIDADEDQGAPFRLGDADEVHIIDTSGAPVDSLIYLYREPGRVTLARHPDGEGLFFASEPSPGEANR